MATDDRRAVWAYPTFTHEVMDAILSPRRNIILNDGFGTITVETPEPRECTICHAPIVSGRCNCNP